MAAYYTFEDLSGSTPNSSSINKTDNPYHDLIESCQNDPARIQQRYETHRMNRNAQQREKLLADEFEGVTVDGILARLVAKQERQEEEDGFEDPRHCLVFWARPTREVRELIARVQEKLREVFPGLWLMPPENLHMTALEITHSRTAPEIDDLVAQFLSPQQPGQVASAASAAEEMTNILCDNNNNSENHHDRRVRLIKPMISFDAQALALSWLPAAGATAADNAGLSSGEGEKEAYTYHHLRRDLFTLASEAGVKVASRYVIPSAHLTIGRFIRTEDLEREDGDGDGKKVDGKKVAALVNRIEEVNRDLIERYWPKDGEEEEEEAGGMEWIVGQEKGLDFRKGTLWYGGGETVMLGKGF